LWAAGSIAGGLRSPGILRRLTPKQVISQNVDLTSLLPASTIFVSSCESGAAAEKNPAIHIRKTQFFMICGFYLSLSRDRWLALLP
jgi:hypothetical protein